MSTLALGTVRVQVNYENGTTASVRVPSQVYLTMHEVHTKCVAIVRTGVFPQNEALPSPFFSGLSVDGLPFEIRLGSSVVSLTAEVD